VGGPAGGPPENTSYERFNMEINDKYLLKNKLDYLRLTLKISRLRYHGKEPDMNLLLQAQKIGHLAHIPDDELNNLLFNLNIQS
jgi:hypothetical protein